MIGETVSHFRITDKLGQGGMGVVYRGVDLDLDRPVAIKILPPEAQEDADSVGRFLREAKTASRLQHPAITTIYEFGVKEGMRYLVMELIDGRTLRQMVESGPLPVRQAVEIAIQMADALSLASEKGIIHRDIKSDNVMVTARGQVKILDFGLAKMVEKTGPVDSFQTAVGLVMGTISYMSPEQALGADLDPRTDIYSTGVVMYEMLAGRQPFTGNTPQVVINKVLNDKPLPLSSLNAQVPPAVEQLVHRCLEKDREKRYASATQLLLELKAVKQQIESGREWSGTIVAQAGSLGAQAAAPTASRAGDLPTVGATQPVAAPKATQPVAAPAPPAASGGTVAVPPPSGSGRQPSGGAPPAAAPSGSGRQPSAGVPAAAPARAAGPAHAPSPRPRAAGTGAVMAGRRTLATLVGVGRRLFMFACLLYVLGCVAVFALPALGTGPKAKVKLPPAPVRVLHQAVDPVAEIAGGVVRVNLTYRGFNFLLLGLAIGVYLLQQLIGGKLNRLEEWLRKPRAKAGTQQWAPGTVAPPATASAGEASRMSLLRDYAAAQRILGEAKKHMAFLSIDVAGSTQMKVGEDKLSIEHAFSEYKKFLERVFREFQVWKVAWTPDGVMTCFPSPEDAAYAARKILVDLDWFNEGVHQLRAKFRVRCGLNFGEVMMPDNKPLEEVSDEVIDVAGHMQKYAEVDSLWISADTFRLLADRSGYTRGQTQVDGRDVYVWRKPS